MSSAVASSRFWASRATERRSFRSRSRARRAWGNARLGRWVAMTGTLTRGDGSGFAQSSDVAFRLYPRVRIRFARRRTPCLIRRMLTRFSVAPLHAMTRSLAAVAMGRAAPDLVITGARLLSTYTERMHRDRELWIKGGR